MAKKPKAKADTKSGDKSGPRPGDIVPQPHGGALRHGSLPGNTPGTGRPPSAVRAACREAFAARIPILEHIADDEAAPYEQRRLAVDALGKHGLGGSVSPDDVRERLKLTLNEIRTFPGLAADQAALLVERIKQHWVSA